MKTKIQFVLLFVICLSMVGCRRNSISYIEVKSIEQFKAIDVNKVSQIDIKAVANLDNKNDPNRWVPKYEFCPISEHEKITRIMTYIRDSEPIKSYTMRMVMCFKTADTIYFMGFENDGYVRSYGTFWESKELRQYLKELGLVKQKAADSNSQINSIPPYLPPVPYEGEIPSDAEVEKFIFKDANSPACENK